MKKLIKDLHEIGNIEVKKRIEIDYPELGKPVLEVGKWYKHKSLENTDVFKKDEDGGTKIETPINRALSIDRRIILPHNPFTLEQRIEQLLEEIVKSWKTNYK